MSGLRPARTHAATNAYSWLSAPAAIEEHACKRTVAVTYAFETGKRPGGVQLKDDEDFPVKSHKGGTGHHQAHD